MVIIDERDFADAKAVAGRDAGCRLEVRVELRPKAAVVHAQQAASSQLRQITQLLGRDVMHNITSSS